MKLANKPTRDQLFFRILLIICFVGISTGAFLTTFFFYQYQHKIYPGISIDGQNVGGLTLEEGTNQLLPTQNLEDDFEVILKHQDQHISSSAAVLKIHRNISQALNDAYSVGRHGSWYQRLTTLFNIQKEKGINISTEPTFDKTEVVKMVTAFKNQIDKSPIPPTATLITSHAPETLSLTPGEDGLTVDLDATVDKVLQSATVPDHTSQVEIRVTQVSLTEEQQNNLMTIIQQNLVGKQLEFTHDYHSFTLSDKKLISFLLLPDEVDQTALSEVIQTWAEEINQPAVQAVFEYNPDTLAVSEFKPPKDGIEVDIDETSQIITDWLKEQLHNQTSSETEDSLTQELPITQSKTENTLAETNDLGINELIGFGESRYDHSIPSRIHNVSLTTSRISNTLVAPGEEFSFNKTLGDVSSLTGFKPAYVIKDGMTVLGDGGGVCQVSSTLFRALLDSGLKITRRLPHSYRVSYYELNSDPGFDATVYAGDTDLRFVNDTDHYVLIHGEADSKNLYMKMEIYGTSDGRTTEVSNYKKWDYSPPLPTEYIPDPSLAPGELKQIDWAAAGIKAQFVHTIYDKDGNVMSQKTYTSNYRPWSAKYLQGI